MSILSRLFGGGRKCRRCSTGLSAGHHAAADRAMTIDALVNLNVGGAELRMVIDGLQDPSAHVRKSAASFFLSRARQDRPVLSALGPLLAALGQEKDRKKDIDGDAEIDIFDRDKLDEAISQETVDVVYCNAIAATVGAKKLVINWENFDLDELQATFEGLRTNDDPVVRADAELYIRHLFPKRR